MERPVSIKVKYTVDDPVRVVKFVRNQSFIYRYDAVLTASIVFVLFTVIIISMADDLVELNILGLVVFSSIPAILVGLVVHFLHRILFPLLARRRVKKYFDSSPIINDETLVEFSNEGIKTTGNLSSSFVKWGAITKVVESETDLMFYTGNESLPWYIPKTALVSDRALNSVKSCLRQNLVEKAKLL